MAEIAGLKLIVPSSVAGSGVSVSASGKVTFTAATSVSVNGCFDSTYDNYLMVCKVNGTINGDTVYFRMRSSGTDATGSNYTRQRYQANGTTVDATRNTSQNAGMIGPVDDDTPPSGFHCYLYGPALTQPTATRGVTVGAFNGAVIVDWATTHSLSTSYDGISIFGGAGNAFTGALTIYGLSQ